MAAISFAVNARPVEVAAHGDTPLLDVLRNHLGLTGTRFGCGLEQCGACMVLIDGMPAKSCGKALSAVVGRTVLTVEPRRRRGEHR
jgi:aerobic-type carbon monoxide dehydrogenase small subunit (CoxS/CutS family)